MLKNTFNFFIIKWNYLYQFPQKKTILQKAKEPFYKRKKIHSTKIKKGIIKKKLLYRNKLLKYERKYL